MFRFNGQNNNDRNNRVDTFEPRPVPSADRRRRLDKVKRSSVRPDRRDRNRDDPRVSGAVGETSRSLRLSVVFPDER